MFGKFIATAGFLAVFAAAAATPTAAAEVLRGGEAETDDSGQTGEIGAVVIIRGDVPEQAEPGAPPRSDRPATAPRLIATGENLWILDEDEGTITGCDLRDSHFIPIGEARTISDVRCRTESWPQDSVYFLGMHHRL